MPFAAYRAPQPPFIVGELQGLLYPTIPTIVRGDLERQTLSLALLHAKRSQQADPTARLGVRL